MIQSCFNKTWSNQKEGISSRDDVNNWYKKKEVCLRWCQEWKIEDRPIPSSQRNTETKKRLGNVHVLAGQITQGKLDVPEDVVRTRTLKKQNKYELEKYFQQKTSSINKNVLLCQNLKNVLNGGIFFLYFFSYFSRSYVEKQCLHFIRSRAKFVVFWWLRAVGLATRSIKRVPNCCGLMVRTRLLFERE